MANKTKIKQRLAKILFGLAVFGLVFSLASVGFVNSVVAAVDFSGVEQFTGAVGGSSLPYGAPMADVPGGGFPVSDIGAALGRVSDKLQSFWEKILKNTAGVAFKSALGYFLNTVAYKTATWLVSGGPGQTPTWDTKELGQAIVDAGDAAGGVFIEKLGQGGQTDCHWINYYTGVPDGYNEVSDNYCAGVKGAAAICICKPGLGFGKFNLCEPDFAVKMQIGLGLAETEEPSAPSCTFSQMKKNWEEELSDPNFLNKFQASFNPWENDVGIAFSLQTGLLETKTEAKATKELNRTLEAAMGGFMDMVDKIGTTRLTPGGLIKTQADLMLEQSTKKETTWVDTPWGVGNAITAFTTTLVGKLSQRLFQEGLYVLGGGKYGKESESSGSSYSAGLYNYEGEGGYGGVAAAQMRFAEFLEAGFVTGGPYEILQKLTVCPNPNQPGSTDCVIDERFRQAIENKTQVRNLDPDILQRPFGVIGREAKSGQALEPSYKEGFPLRSLIILRKYRIIPVGWELAAQYISQFADKTYNLGDLVQLSEKNGSEFFGLIEPDWVLKAPENYCRRQGPGPDVASNELVAGYDKNKDGDYEDPDDVAPYVSLYRNESYCADEQSCIVENDDGSCRFYGYCTEEKRVWNFGADNCQKDFNTCQTFTSRKGATASYLKNSLAYNGCNVDNVGCWWFCQDYDEVASNWACASPGRSYKQCDARSGCLVSRSCFIPNNSSQCLADQDKTLLVSTTVCQKSEGCAFSISGIIPYTATQTIIPACSGSENLLANSGFEDGTGYDAANWTEQEAIGSVNNGYHRRVKKSEAHSGNYVLESYNNAVYTLETKASPIQIKKGSYILSGWIYNNLNAGRPFISVDGGSIANCSGIPANQSKTWSQFFCQLRVGADAFLTVKLKTENAKGTLWFDDIKLQENCLGQAVTIYNGDTFENYTEANDGNDIYLDAQAESCPANANGCSELIRTKAGLGTNLVSNSGLEDYDGTAGDGVADKVAGWNVFPSTNLFISNESLFGQTSVKIPNTISPIAGLTQDINLGTSPTGKVFTLSFWAKLAAGSESKKLKFYMQEDWQGEPADDGNDCDSDHHFAEGAIGDADKTVTGEWQRFFTTAVIKDPGDPDYSYCSDNMMRINIFADAEVLIDSVQLEELGQSQIESGNKLTDYKDYGSINQTYLKKPPEYYNCQGYTASRPGEVDAALTNKTICEKTPNRVWYLNKCRYVDPVACAQFTQVCFEDEISCQWYAPLNGDPKVPGVAKYPDDFCPAECAGYQTYKQEPTNFEFTIEGFEYFIASTAKKCSAQQVGCDEFTNLDEVAKGGEGREYYTYIRQCQKLDNNCGTFYTWIGSEVNGYQLQTYNLRKSKANSQAPCTKIKYVNGQPTCVDNGKDTCEQADTLTNPDCREFYDVSGKVSYHLFSLTITCSDDCHPYRKTVAEQDNCKESGGWWNSNRECIYNAIPNQGIKCPATAAGCRAYTGNAGKNIMNVFFDTFEDGTNQGWQGGKNSNESVNVGGHSLLVEANPPGLKRAHLRALTYGSGAGTQKIFYAMKPTGDLTYQNSTYLLEFWAKGKGVADAAVGFVQLGKDDSGQTNIPYHKNFNGEKSPIKLTPQWRYYSLGPITLDWQTTENDYLVFITTAGAYFDNIVLKEVTDSVFVIRNSWQTPISCDNDYFDPNGSTCGGTASAPKRCTGPKADPISIPAMLGCEAYRDSQNQTLYLKSFDHLCREEAVGCEAFIDTYNSSTPFEKIYQPGDDSATTVPADQTILLVNDSKKTCEAENKGCLGLGRPTLDQNDKVASYQTVYLKNNPDKYDSIMCLATEVGCEEYTSGNSSAYFKDPGVKVCDYKALAGDNKKSWYKRGTDEECPINVSQLGINYPKDGWAGICPANQSACTEFIDPISPYNKNLIFNGGFEQQTSDNKPDGWDSVEGVGEIPDTSGNRGVKFGSQTNILFEPETLYTLSFSAKAPIVGTGGQFAIIALQNCNQALSPLVNSPDGSMIVRDKDLFLVVKVSNDLQLYSGRFYSANMESCGRLTFGSADNLPNYSTTDAYKFGSGFWFDDISLRKTGVYYKINDAKIDKTACNGQVDFNQGCVLFNDRSAINWKEGEGNNKYLVFDADQSPVAKGMPKTGCDKNPNDNYSEACDANVLLKVQPDRVCDEWLYCQSSVATINDKGEKENMCFDVGLCNSVDEQGKCDGQPSARLTQAGNQTYEKATVAKIKNLSGYSKVGFKWDPANSANSQIVEGDYPVYQMEQAGNLAEVINGNFELADATGQPRGWNQDEDVYETAANDSLNWDPAYFKVVDDPIEAADNGVCYKSATPCLAPEGKNFLKVNGVYEATSSFISVTGNTPYIISAFINSHWLSAGDTGILIFEYNNQTLTKSGKSGVCVPATPSIFLEKSNPPLFSTPCNTDDECVIDGYTCKNWSSIKQMQPVRTPAGQDWDFKTFKFDTSPGVSKIKIKLFNYQPGEVKNGITTNKATGSSYFDDIQLKPALQTGNVKSAGLNEIIGYTSRSCRLYPKTDSLACEYTDDKGAQYKGWRGYCLEYDRPPGNTNTCLLWWPVDVIQGEYWGPDFGYNDRYPLYYCLAAEGSRLGEGFCADKELVYSPGMSESWSYFWDYYGGGGLANCGGELLGGTGGYSIAEFNNGFFDGKGPKGPEDTNSPNITWNKATGVKDGERWDLMVNLGCASDKEATEVSVSNNLKDWISLGVVWSGEGKWCECHFEGNCCPTGGDCADSSYRCGCGGKHINKVGSSSDTNYNKTFFDGLNVAIIGYAMAVAGPAGAGFASAALAAEFLDNFFGTNLADSLGSLLDDLGLDKWFGGANQQTPDYYVYLPYLFDLKGTPAEGGHYKYVKLTTKWSENLDGSHKGGPEVSNLRAFYQPVACTFLSQVVTPSGQNKAWLDRINKSSNFSILGHNYSDDWPPFGGVIPPQEVANPTLWDSRSDENWPGKQPLFKEDPDTENFEVPYQARAGTPYSVMSEEIVEKGRDRVKQLFAESYGSWQWGGEGICNNSKQSCKRDDCPGGSCLSYSRCVLKTNQSCEVSTCGFGPGIACIKSLTPDGEVARCKGGFYSGKPCCPDDWGVCGRGEKSEDKDELVYYGFCPDNSASADCQVNCLNCQKQSDGQWRCQDGGAKQDKLCCGANPPYNLNLICQDSVNYKCNAGTNQDKNCAIDECPSGSCDFGDKRYYATTSQMWSPPITPCQDNVRPDYNSTDLEKSYCGISPIVDDIKVNGKGTGQGLVLNQGGFATLTFTSQIDPNQLPITGYAIKWGDNNSTLATGIKINQNSSPENPHTFYHYYNYWDIRRQVGVKCYQCKDKEKCNTAGVEVGDNVCEIVPMIQVKDNWGWCNATILNQPNTGYYGNDCDIQTNSYTPFGGTIYVTEK